MIYALIIMIRKLPYTSLTHTYIQTHLNKRVGNLKNHTKLKYLASKTSLGTERALSFVG